jgi:phage terminase small subunit
MALTDQQKLFVEHYADCLNASEAARRAKYSEETAGQQGYRLLQNKAIQAAIKRKLDAQAMSSNEVLHRLAAMARGDVTNFWKVNELGAPYFDFQACSDAGLLYLIKKVTYSKDGDVASIEFYDAQNGLVQLGRHHKLFVDNVDVTSKGEKVQAGPTVFLPAVEPEPEDDGQ